MFVLCLMLDLLGFACESSSSYLIGLILDVDYYNSYWYSSIISDDWIEFLVDIDLFIIDSLGMLIY